MLLYRSCPADKQNDKVRIRNWSTVHLNLQQINENSPVSQICSWIRLLFQTMVLLLKSIPTVGTNCELKEPSTKRKTSDVFPTSESPMTRILKYSSNVCSALAIVLASSHNPNALWNQCLPPMHQTKINNCFRKPIRCWNNIEVEVMILWPLTRTQDNKYETKQA